MHQTAIAKAVAKSQRYPDAQLQLLLPIIKLHDLSYHHRVSSFFLYLWSMFSYRAGKYLIAFLLPLFIILSEAGNIFAQNPPQFVSMSVNADGTILATWNTSGTPDGVIFHYKRGTEALYQSVSLPGSATSYLIPVNDGQDFRYDAYLTTIQGTNESQMSNRLSTILLVVSKDPVNEGVALLSWNAMNPSLLELYQVERSINAGPWELLGNTTSRTYRDTLYAACDQITASYRVAYINGIQTVTSTIGENQFIDDIPPADAVFTHISINEDGEIVLNWQKSSSEDVTGYRLEYKTTGNTFPEEYFVDLPDTDTYTFPASLNPLNPCDTVITFIIKAIDACGISSRQFVYETFRQHNTIKMSIDLESNCQRKATLRWNEYRNLASGVGFYEIWRSHNGSTAEKVGEVSAAVSPLEFTDPGLLNAGEQYTYHIRATGNTNGIYSESCRVQAIPDPEPLEDFLLSNVSVINSEYIDLSVSGRPLSLISQVEIMRSPESPSALQPLGTVAWSSDPAVLPETSAEVNSTAYYYQLTAYDRCNNVVAQSGIYRSIFLQLTDIGNDVARLSWNEFEGWGSDLTGYEVYRLRDGVVDAGFPKSAAPGELVLIDDDPEKSNGRIDYYVEALHSGNLRSRSNVVQLKNDAEIISPNAFRPGGINPVFKPLIKNIENNNYRFTVYNRWGQVVFDTSNPSAAWDGTLNGSSCEAGVYAWHVSYTDFKGLTDSRRGVVMLLR